MLNKNKSFPHEENEETDEVKKKEHSIPEKLKNIVINFGSGVINAVYTANEESIKKQSGNGDHANTIESWRRRKDSSVESLDTFGGESPSSDSKLKNDMPSAEHKVQQASSSARARELYEQSVLLREEMARLNGGDRSMAALYEHYQESKGNSVGEGYKRSFEVRQERLREVLKEYKATKEKLDTMLGAEAFRFDFPKDLYVYEELSRIELNEDNMTAQESQSVPDPEIGCETET